jgi:hypothetical protein
MQQLRRLVAVTSLCAVWLVGVEAQDRRQPPSTWPTLFPGATDAPAQDADWEEARVGAAGVAFRVPHPKTWTVAESKVPLITIKSPNGRHFVQISEPLPLPSPIPLPFPAGQIQQATESLSKVFASHSFRAMGGGQAFTGGRWWLWQDQMVPPSEVSRLPAEVRAASTAEFDSLRLWLFITGVESKGVIVFCWALVSRGLSEADVERELRPAAAVFDRMIKRMGLQTAGG